MADTIINTPSPAGDSGGGMGMVIGLVALLVVAYIFFIYGLPAIRNINTQPQINVPDKIDINISK